MEMSSMVFLQFVWLLVQLFALPIPLLALQVVPSTLHHFLCL
jgi:hypothetical protein